MIEDFGDFTDPQTLYAYFLGSKSSPFILRAIAREEKSTCLFFNTYFFFLEEIATRFSKDNYARVKEKRNEPLSLISIETKKRHVEKSTIDAPTTALVSSSVPGPTKLRDLLPTLSLEELTPRPNILDKGKTKIGLDVWEDTATAVGRAHNVVISEELKSLSTVPSHELVNHYMHKLVQVFYFFHSFHFSSSVFLLTEFFFARCWGNLFIYLSSI